MGRAGHRWACEGHHSLPVKPAVLHPVVPLFLSRVCPPNSGGRGPLPAECPCPSPQFSCCGGVSYKDWSQNMYFNCTAANPSRERCSVPFSCCLRDTDEVRTASSGGPQVSSGELCFASLLPSLRDVLSLKTPPQEREYHWQCMGAHLPSGFGDPRLGMLWWGQDEAPLCGGVCGLFAGRQGPCQPCHPRYCPFLGTGGA